MKHLMTLMALVVAVTAGAQSTYDPDVDGDGCITVTDVLGVLSLFDTCEEGAAVYYFRSQQLMPPFYTGDLLTVTNPFYLINDTGGYVETSQFSEAFDWALDHQGETITDEFGNDLAVCQIDSVSNVSLPLSQSIPNGTIQFPETEGVGRMYFVISDDIDFSFSENAAFYPVQINCETPSNLTPMGFEWNDSAWTLYEVGGFALNSGSVNFNVVCGY